MDIISRSPMAIKEVAKAISGKRVIVGAKQLRKALNSGAVCRVFLATDADPAITEPIMNLCQLHKVTFDWVKSMTELGKACGIEVGAVAAATLNSI